MFTKEYNTLRHHKNTIKWFYKSKILPEGETLKNEQIRAEILYTILKRLSEYFEKSKITYTLLKQYKLVKRIGSDLDILVEDKKFNEVIKYLINNNWVIQFSEKHEKFKIRLLKVIDGKIVALHIHRRISWNGIEYLDFKEILKRRVKYQRIYHPSKEDEFMIIMAHALFENNKIPLIDLLILKDLLTQKLDYNYIKMQTKRFGWYPAFMSFQKIMKQQLTRQYTTNPNIEFSILELYKNRIYKMLHDLRFNTNNVLDEFFTFFINPLTSRLKRKKIILTLSGIDGSGKTTLSLNIIKELKVVGLNFNVKWCKKRPIISKLFRLSKKTPSTNQKFNKSNYTILNKSILIRMVWLSILLFEYIPQLWIKTLRAYILKTTLICDRFIYDTEADICIRLNNTPKIFLKILRFLSPKPTLSFYIDVSIDNAMKRKPKENEERLKLLSKIFKKIIPQGVIIINGNLPKKKITSKILSVIIKEIIHKRRDD